jgi:hypothetical protein
MVVLVDNEIPLFSSMQLTAVEVSKLLAKDVLAAAKGKLTIPCAVRKRKSTVTNFIVANLTPTLEGSLNKLLTRQPHLQQQQQPQTERESERMSCCQPGKHPDLTPMTQTWGNF